MKKMIMAVMLIITLLLQGCSGIQQEVSSSEKIPNTILTGCNLDQLGWSIDFKNLKPFYDENIININYKPDYGLLHYNKDIQIVTIDGDLSTYGSVTVLGIHVSDNITDISFIPILYLQGFYKSNNSQNKKQIIEINTKYYEVKDLVEHKLYEDEEIMIFDVTDLLAIKDFDSKLKLMTNQKTLEYDYSWLKEVYEYLNTQEAIIFQKKKNS